MIVIGALTPMRILGEFRFAVLAVRPRTPLGGESPRRAETASAATLTQIHGGGDDAAIGRDFCWTTASVTYRKRPRFSVFFPYLATGLFRPSISVSFRKHDLRSSSSYRSLLYIIIVIISSRYYFHFISRTIFFFF